MFRKNANASVNRASDTYIGLRVNLYGPVLTSVLAGRTGIMLVCFRRNSPTLDAANPTQPATSSHATTVSNSVALAIGSGRRRCSIHPPTTASAYNNGGGKRTPGLSVLAFTSAILLPNLATNRRAWMVYASLAPYNPRRMYRFYKEALR